MTKNQLKYNFNARRSIALTEKLEKLTEEMYFYDKYSNHAIRDHILLDLAQIRDELNAIWTEQVDLFYKIRNREI